MDLINVVAPIYNEFGGIKEFVKRVKIALEKFTEEYKILLIDDGSTDNSWNEISELCSNDSKVIGIKLSKNFGHHFAITAGIHNSKSKWVIVMDTDLQDRPEVIPDLFHKANEGFDIVFVSRKQRPESWIYKLLQKTFYYLLQILSGTKFDSTQANFSIISHRVAKSFLDFSDQARYYGSTIKWLGFKRTSIQANHGERFHGSPSYTFKKRLKLASDIILSFSDRPLKFLFTLGIVSIIFTLVSAIILGLTWFKSGQRVEDLTIYVLLLFFATGLILTALGIIGIYVGAVFKQVKNRPLYIVEERINLV